MNRLEYLETLAEQIRNKNARALVLKEIAAHIEDQKCAYLAEGKNEEEAEILAVKEMGNPVDAGARLDKIHRPKTDFWMLGTIMLLTLIGIIMQSVICSQWDNNVISSTYHIRTILYNLAGFAVMLIAYFGDYRLFGKYLLPVYGVYLAGSFLLMRAPFGWIQILLVSQSANVLFVPLFAAFCYTFRGQKAKGILKALGLLVLNTLLLLLFGSYISLAMLLSVTACLITLCAAACKGFFGGRKKLQTGVLLTSIIGFPALFLGDVLLFGGRFLFLADYQIRRIQAMFHPALYAETAGFQTMLVRKQLSDASLFGGGSVGKVGELSGAWCDYVLTCLSAYLGLFAAFAVIALIVVFFLRSLHISFMQHNRLGFLLGISCSSILILKTIVYVAMNFGIGPPVGIDMPFLTYGLHCTVINFLFMGIILSVYRNTNLLSEDKTTPARWSIKIEKADR